MQVGLYVSMTRNKIALIMDLLTETRLNEGFNQIHCLHLFILLVKIRWPFKDQPV